MAQVGSQFQKLFLLCELTYVDEALRFVLNTFFTDDRWMQNDLGETVRV